MIKELNSKRFITVKQFATEYGIGTNKSYEIVHKRDFPKIKLGRKILVIRDKVDEFFDKNIGEEF